jgi:uncharacterized SAM-binding protein YcdF (DUF218 family)
MKRFLAWLVGGAIISVGVIMGLLLGIGYFLAPQSDLAKADAIVAISGGETEARAGEAIRLYQEGYGQKLIFSGAAQDRGGPSNAQEMLEQALDRGVEADNILIEELAENTSQNAAEVAKLVRQEHYQSIILVTSPYHQRRAYIAFSRALGPGFTIINHSAPDQSWRRSHWWASPYAYGVTLAELQKTVFLLVTGGQ